MRTLAAVALVLMLVAVPALSVVAGKRTSTRLRAGTVTR